MLVIATARAPALVPCVEGRDTKYYLRFDHSTLPIPEYLATDLVLGRRQRPVLSPRIPNGTINRVAPDSRSIHFSLEVVNEGLQIAPDVEVGVVSLGLPGGEASGGVGTPWANRATDHLRTFVAMGEQPSPPYAHVELVHVSSRRPGIIAAALHAFEGRKISGIGAIRIPGLLSIPVQSALYILSSGHAPDWYQFDFTIGQTRVFNVNLQRTIVERPVVAWDTPFAD